MNKPNLIFQFKISLQEITPSVWRRIQVPGKYSFWDLHVAIQDSMGWMDCHLHAYRLKRTHGRKIMEIGIPDDYDDDARGVVMPGWQEFLTDYFTEPGQKVEYEYDFGDGWTHEILLEGLLLKEKGVRYPQCLGGQRACPPEDCGGPFGYEDLLKILRDPKHEEYKSMVEWLKGWYGKYDPEKFDHTKVKFDNPLRRFEKVFSE